MDLTINKVAAGVVGLAMVAGLAFAFTATRVHATSLAELVELFIALEVIAPEKADEARAALAGMQTTTPTTPGAPTMSCNFTRNLTIGDTGPDVMDLQKLLNLNGFTLAVTGAGSPGQETSYFGPATAGAVAKMQEAFASEILTPLGLTAGTGYFGASTRAKANEICSAAPTTPTVPTVPGDEDEDEDEGSSELSGGEGYVDWDVLLDSDIQLDLGDSEAVIEVELEAKDSDVAINRVDFHFDLRPWLYFDEVNLLMDGEEVGSLSGSGDFTEVSGEYRARFSGLDFAIEEDETAVLSLELVVRSSMTGSRDDDTVQVWIPERGVRARDGADINQYVPEGTTVGPINVDFDDQFGEGTISVTISDKSPENAVIVLNESSRTDDVAVVYFNVEADDSDMEVKTVDVNFGVGTSTVADTLYRARLYVGNTLLSTKSVGSATTTFTDVDYMIDEDDEVEFRVEVDFNRADGIGSGITGAETFTVNAVDVTAENADYVEDSESLIVSEQHWVLVSGLVSEIVSVSNPVMSNDDKNAKYTFVFDVTAIEDTYYVAEDFDLAFIVSTSAASAVITGGAVTSDATLDGDTYRVSKGQTKEFTVEVFVTATGTDAVNRVTLEYMNFDATKAGAEATGGDRQTLLGTPDYRSATANIIAS